LNDAVVFVYPYEQLKVKSSSFMEAIIVDRSVRKFKKSSSEMNCTNISSFKLVKPLCDFELLIEEE
jgi:hypothetical protein